MRPQLTHFASAATTSLAESIETANTRALDAVIDANRRFVEFAVTTSDRLADQINFELPFADRLPTLPTPAENGERYLDFVQRAVAVNRDFNDRIVTMLKVDAPAAAEKVSEKVTEKVTGTVNDAVDAVSAPAERTAKKTVARTTPARKAAAKRAATTKTAAKKTAAKKTAKSVASKAPTAK